MIQCAKCKAQIDDDSWYCDQCGEQLMMCPKCRAPRKGKRCTTCGSVLITAEELVSTPSQPQPSAKSSRPPQTSTPNPSSDPGDAGMSTEDLFSQSGNIFGDKPFVSPQQSKASGTHRPQPQAGGGTLRGVNTGPRIADTEPSRFVRVDDPTKVVTFKPGGIIGRTTGDYLDVFSSCGYVSGTHGKITLHSSMRWLYTDLGSTNGTILEGHQLEPNKNYPLKKGQTIEIGYVKFRVE